MLDHSLSPIPDTHDANMQMLLRTKLTPVRIRGSAASKWEERQQGQEAYFGNLRFVFALLLVSPVSICHSTQPKP